MNYILPRQRRDKSLASELRHQITIQNFAPSSDGQGGHISGWEDALTTWASINPIRANQKTDYKSISVDVTHYVKVRGNVTCDITQQIKFGDRYLEILSVENIQERDVHKVLICRETSR